ncbi:transcriptional regulator [Leucobacter sp. BZR 635]
MAHPRHELDSAFHTPLRFSLMAALSDGAVIDFGTLRELLETEDSPLSKSVAHLEAAGYVKVTKGYVGKRPRTWVETTAKGGRAFARHVAALRAIADGI